jgi:hypothetical protein
MEEFGEDHPGAGTEALGIRYRGKAPYSFLRAGHICPEMEWNREQAHVVSIMEMRGLLYF